MIERDEELLRVLSNSVRVMTVNQIAQTWWSPTSWGRSRAKKRLRELAQCDTIQIRTLLARALHPLARPLIFWSAGDVTPNLRATSRKLHLRAQRPASLTAVVRASDKVANLLGKGKRPTTKLSQLTHDLQVSEVFLHYRARGQGGQWRSEDRLPTSWNLEIRPDALLCDSSGEWVHAIEYGGDYTFERLLALHHGFQCAQLSYEVW